MPASAKPAADPGSLRQSEARPVASAPHSTGAIRDAWRLARGWGRAEPWRATGLVSAALGLILLQLAVDWGFALWHRAAFDALGARDGTVDSDVEISRHSGRHPDTAVASVLRFHARRA
jgi:hypothetical protein